MGSTFAGSVFGHPVHVAFLTGGLDKKQVKTFLPQIVQSRCGNVLTDYVGENDKSQIF